MNRRTELAVFLLATCGVTAFAVTAGPQKVIVDDKDNEILFQRYNDLLDKLKITTPMPLPEYHGGVFNCVSIPADACKHAAEEREKKDGEARAKLNEALSQNRLLEDKEHYLQLIVRKSISGEIDKTWIEVKGREILSTSHGDAIAEIITRVEKGKKARAQAFIDLKAKTRKGGMKKAAHHPVSEKSE